MGEKILVESKRAVNFFIPLALVLFFGGLIFSEVAGADGLEYCIYPWALSFYYVWPSVILLVVGLIFSRTELVITDKRAYGKTAFGKRVDLPLDSISATGTSALKGVSIATASGKITFNFIKNRDEIHKCVSDLLIARQEKEKATTIKQEIARSDADELKKYKELLDGGVITQEEFDAKKKQLLNL